MLKKEDNEKEDKENKKRMMVCAVNNIGDEGARMIGEALKSNSALTELNLGGGLKNKQKMVIKSLT